MITRFANRSTAVVAVGTGADNRIVIKCGWPPSQGGMAGVALGGGRNVGGRFTGCRDPVMADAARA